MKRAKAKRKPKKRTKMLTVQINLSGEHLAYVREIAEYSCTSIDVVCAVMMGCGIFQAKRYKPPQTASEPPAPEPVAPAAPPEATP